MAVTGAEPFAAFLSALDVVGVESDIARVDRSDWDAAGTIEGVDVVVRVLANPTPADALALGEATSDAYKVLVARHVWEPTREVLHQHGIGYFDGRGRLRLWHRPLLVDRDVGPVAEPTRSSGVWHADSPSALDVALAVLDGTARDGVRATAEVIGRSPGTVSKQLAALRSAYLADEEGRPAVPALFEAVLEQWDPVRVPLGDLPKPGAGPVNERLGLELDDPKGPGWVLADARAASAWGAPVVLAGDAPPDFYVPDPATLTRARTLLGAAEFGTHACTVAVAPCPYVCLQRFDRAARHNEEFLAPSPIVAALDLAHDPARGRETLERWERNLPPELTRVW